MDLGDVFDGASCDDSPIVAGQIPNDGRRRWSSVHRQDGLQQAGVGEVHSGALRHGPGDIRHHLSLIDAVLHGGHDDVGDLRRSLLDLDVVFLDRVIGGEVDPRRDAQTDLHLRHGVGRCNARVCGDRGRHQSREWIDDLRSRRGGKLPLERQPRRDVGAADGAQRRGGVPKVSGKVALGVGLRPHLALSGIPGVVGIAIDPIEGAAAVGIGIHGRSADVTIGDRRLRERLVDIRDRDEEGSFRKQAAGVGGADPDRVRVPGFKVESLARLQLRPVDRKGGVVVRSRPGHQGVGEPVAHAVGIDRRQLADDRTEGVVLGDRGGGSRRWCSGRERDTGGRSKRRRGVAETVSDRGASRERDGLAGDSDVLQRRRLPPRGLVREREHVLAGPGGIGELSRHAVERERDERLALHGRRFTERDLKGDSLALGIDGDRAKRRSARADRVDEDLRGTLQANWQAACADVSGGISNRRAGREGDRAGDADAIEIDIPGLCARGEHERLRVAALHKGGVTNCAADLDGERRRAGHDDLFVEIQREREGRVGGVCLVRGRSDRHHGGSDRIDFGP